MGMVEEVARNLRGMGFETDVVCGAEARDALLGHRASEPTIYVICVQGTLKETVLKPLRQALAAHGGPNAHLFVAVLDLSLPLSMVGQIRRFAETLERTPLGLQPARSDTLGERRQWRQHMGSHQRRRYATRNHRTTKLVERSRARSDTGTTSKLRTGPRRLVADRKPARMTTTNKYRAVTGPLPTAERRRAETSRRSQSATVRRQVVVPQTASRARDEAVAPIVAGRQRRAGNRGWLLVGLLGVVGAGLWWSWTSTDGPQRRDVPRDESNAHAAAGESANAHQGGHPSGSAEDGPGPRRQGDAPAHNAVDDEAPVDHSGAHGRSPEPTGDAPTERSHASDEAGPSTSSDDGEMSSPTGDATESSNELDPAQVEARLASLAQTSDLRETDTMYVTSRQGETTTWKESRRRCDDLEVEGVLGWRLPYRRELKLLGAIGALRSGVYWSKTALDSDRDFAFVYDTQRRELATWLKAEPTAYTVCVRRK